MSTGTDGVVYTIEQLDELIKPLPRSTRTFNCGFHYLETWLHNESLAISGGVELNPDFQRGHVWTDEQQLSFIENVLRRIVDDSGLTIRFNCPSWRNERSSDSDVEDQLVCLDGLQRLNAIRRFIGGEIKPFGIEPGQLPRRILLRELTLTIKVYDFQYRKELLKFYLDINGGGTPHSQNELSRVRAMLEELTD